MNNVLLIGYGAIGQYLFKALQETTHSRISAVLCRPGREERVKNAFGEAVPCLSDLTPMPSFDYAIECAGHEAFRHHVPGLLQAGVNVLAVSSGALADRQFADDLEQSAREGQARLTLVSGAVGAIDALSSARIGGLDSVVYRGRKPVSGWRGSPAEQLLALDDVTCATTFFRGTARQAALEYPKNANVAATIALAGLGFDNTTVELVADPDIRVNCHELEAHGTFGKLQFSIEGKPLAGNPRSSALTAMSLVKAMEKLHDSVVLG